MKLYPCGTGAAYVRHIRKNEKPCKKCSDKNRENKRNWARENKEKTYISNKKWISANLDKHRAKERRRRAKIKNNGYSKYTEQEVLSKYGEICYLCNFKIDLSAGRSIGSKNWQNGLHIDHFIPISLGGPDTLENVRPTHGLCNIKKHKKLF
jgi:5-methylcytosine-specific restriction endonuclease McrA